MGVLNDIKRFLIAFDDMLKRRVTPAYMILMLSIAMYSVYRFFSAQWGMAWMQDVALALAFVAVQAYSIQWATLLLYRNQGRGLGMTSLFFALWFLVFCLSGLQILTMFELVSETPKVTRDAALEAYLRVSDMERLAPNLTASREIRLFRERVDAALRNFHSEMFNTSGNNTCGIGGGARNAIQELARPEVLNGFEVLTGSDRERSCSEENKRRLVGIERNYREAVEARVAIIMRDRFLMPERERLSAEIKSTMARYREVLDADLKRLDGVGAAFNHTMVKDVIGNLEGIKRDYDDLSRRIVKFNPEEKIEVMDISHAKEAEGYGVLRIWWRELGWNRHLVELVLALILDFMILHLMKGYVEHWVATRRHDEDLKQIDNIRNSGIVYLLRANMR